MAKRLAVLAALIFFLGALSVLSGIKTARAAYYDLAVSRIYTNPAAPALNVPCEIIVEIKSLSDSAISGTAGFTSYEYTFGYFDLISSALPDISPAKTLIPDGTASYVFKGSFTRKGNSGLSFVVDKENELGETNMTNNTLRGGVGVVAPDELEITGIDIWPLSITVDQASVVTVTLMNKGYRDLGTNVGISSYAFNFPNFTRTKLTAPNISLANKFLIGGSTTYQIEGYFTSPGEKKLTFSVDTDNQLDEINETDNTYAKNYTVVSPALLDLAVESISVTAGTDYLIKSAEAEIVVKIKNQSGYSLTSGNGFWEADCIFKFAGFEVREKIQGAYPSAATPWNPGGTYEYRYKGQFYDSGSLVLSAAIDTVNKLTEADEKNNQLNKTVTVYASQREADSFDLTGVSASVLSSTTALITWQTSQAADGEVQYRRSIYDLFDRFVITPYLAAWPATDNLMNHSVTLAHLRPGDNYVYKVFTARNDVTKASGEYVFSLPPNDQVLLAGEIEALPDHALGKVTITWATNPAATGYVYYKKSGLTDFIKIGSDQRQAQHAVTIDSLENGNYVYYIESASFVNTVYKSAEKNFYVNKIANADAGSNNASSSAAAGAALNPVSAGSSVSVPPKTITNPGLYQRLKGRIVLTVEANGEAYYVNPQNEKAYYLGRPDDAFAVMRSQGVGITNANLEKIPVGLGRLAGSDSDGDGLSDSLEESLGTAKNKKDTDGDGFNDLVEITGGYNPLGAGSAAVSSAFAQNQKGKIFLQIEKKGEAWYVNPADGKRYFLGRPADAFAVMRYLGLGITNKDFASL